MNHPVYAKLTAHYFTPNGEAFPLLHAASLSKNVFSLGPSTKVLYVSLVYHITHFVPSVELDTVYTITLPNFVVPTRSVR